MTSAPKFNSRAGIVLGATTILALSAGSGAVAAGLVTSDDIKDETIRSVDIKDGGVKEHDLGAGVTSRLGYTGAEWSIVDRNTIGNGDAFLRAGPSSANFGVTSKPPLGVGSLGLRTGSAQDKAVFGNQTDFAGRALSDISTVKYSVFTTGENRSVSPENLPNVQFEVDPNGPGTAGGFATLTFVPEAQPAGWSAVDASTAKRWYYTGGPGAASCNQTTYCTLDEAKAAVAPDATIYTVQLSKGRDNAFSGAVDALTLNSTTYDFEPTGVREVQN